MKRLFEIEFQKLITYTTFWVLIGIHLCLFLLVVFIATQINISVPGFEMKTFFAFPMVWNFIPWLASWFNLLLTILMIVLVGNEFQYRTFRQHIIDGLSRNELIIGKGLVILSIALYSVILVFFTSFTVGLIYSESFSINMLFDKLYILVVYFIQAVAYMSLGMMLVILLKNIALAIVSFILYFFPVEPIIRNIFPDSILSFFPMKVISNLTPMPDIISIQSTNIQAQANGNAMKMLAIDNIQEISLSTNIGFALFYIAIITIISIFIINRRNL